MPYIKKESKASSESSIGYSSRFTVPQPTRKRSLPVVIHYTPQVQPRQFHERRHLTLCSHFVRNNNNGGSQYPVGKLQGRWMHNAGFRPGQTIEIKVYHQKLIIRVVREREENFPDKAKK